MTARCPFSTDYYCCGKPELWCVECGTSMCLIHAAFEHPNDLKHWRNPRCPTCSARRMQTMSRKKQTVVSVATEEEFQAAIDQQLHQGTNTMGVSDVDYEVQANDAEQEQEAAPAVNGAAKDEPADPKTHLDKLAALDKELDHFDSTIEHHKGEMKIAREAREEVIRQMRSIIQKAATPLPLFDAKANKETSPDNEEEAAEEPYSEDAGPSL